MTDFDNGQVKGRGTPLVLKNAAAFLLSAGVAVFALHLSRSSFAVAVGGNRVLVANAELQPGTIVSSADVSWQSVRVPRGFAPINFEGSRQATVLGSIVVSHVSAGAPVPFGSITAAGEGFSIAGGIAAGRSAVTIPADKIGSGVSLLSVGDRVDVVLATDTGRIRGMVGKSTTPSDFGSTLIVRDAKIINISPPLRRDVARNAGRSVTLDLSLDEAQKVALGLTAGTLHLALRSGRGQQDTDMRHMTTVNELLAPGLGTSAEPSATTKVTVIQGRRSQSVEVRR